MATYLASNYGNLTGSLGTTSGTRVARRSGTGYYYYKVDCILNSQNKDTLKSNITARFYIYPTFPSDGSNALNHSNFTPTSTSERMSFKVGGVERVGSAARKITLKGVTNNKVFTWDGDISHNAETGTASVEIIAEFGGTAATYFPPITSVKLNVTLPTIALNPLVYTKVNDTWKTGKAYVKVNGVWKKATGIYVKESNEWKEVTLKG